MKAYLDDVKTGWFKYFLLILLISVACTTIFAGVYKFTAEKKAMNQTNDEVEMEDKKEQVKEPLLNQ